MDVPAEGPHPPVVYEGVYRAVKGGGHVEHTHPRVVTLELRIHVLVQVVLVLQISYLVLACGRFFNKLVPVADNFRYVILQED